MEQKECETLDAELKQLSVMTVKKPIQVVKRLTAIASEFSFDYERQFKDELISEQEGKLLEEFYSSPQDIDFALVMQILEDIESELVLNRKLMRKTLYKYCSERRYNYGDRILELADLIAGSFQSGYSKKEMLNMLRFTQRQLIGISKIIGSDF
jgi:hypothetical protein